MKLNYTKTESEVVIDTMKDENDVVRLVDPIIQQVVLSPKEDEELGACYRLWGRCERCENCTSLKALRTKGRAFKIELCRHRTYLVISRYLCIEGNPYVMEVVNDITNQLLLDSTQKDDISKLIQNYNHLLITDALTGLYNRRFLDENFIPSLQCCHESNITVNVAMLDLDNFKKVNDIYGHQAGDALLKDAGGYWTRCFHSREKGKERLVIRYGGDEILIIVCGISLLAFQQELNTYYQQMRKVCYCTPQMEIPFSITYGVASSNELDSLWDWNDLLQLADHRMYDKKLQYKNEE